MISRRRWPPATSRSVRRGVQAWNLFAAIPYITSLRAGGWEGFSGTSTVLWLGGTPWVTLALAMAVVLAAFYGLMQLGVRIKQSSEACLQTQF
jgi:hypothetical protein